MFNKSVTEVDGMTVRVRYDGSVEISHVNDGGFRHSTVYYFVDSVEECIEQYREKNNLPEEV